MTQPDGRPEGPPTGPEDHQPTQALPTYPSQDSGTDQGAASGQSGSGWAPPDSTPPAQPPGQATWQPDPAAGYGASGYQQTPVYGSPPAYGPAPAYGSPPNTSPPNYASPPSYASPPNYPSAPNYTAGPAYTPDTGYGRPTGYIPPDWPSTPPPGSGQVSQPGGTAPEGGRQRSIAGRVLALAAVVALFAGLIGAVGGVAASRRIWPVASAPTPVKGPSVFSSPQPVGTVAKALLPSVVQIRVMSSGSGATGSGFVISPEGMIATNNHVVAGAAAGAELSVVFEDGDEAKARVVGRSPSYDLAVIKVEAGSRKLEPVVLGDSDALEVGDPVIAIGAPLGLIGTVTTGIISAKNRPVTTGESGENSYMSALQTDAAINPGNSGGPLVDMRGRVVGVNSAIASLGTSMGGQSGSIGLGFSIPVNVVKRVTNEIIRTGKATYPIIGAEIDTTYSGNGARISTVQPGSPAAQAGLKNGDVITVVDGTRVTSGVELIVKIRSNVPGATIKLSTGTGSTQHVYSVRLGSKDG